MSQSGKSQRESAYERHGSQPQFRPSPCQPRESLDSLGRAVQQRSLSEVIRDWFLGQRRPLTPKFMVDHSLTQGNLQHENRELTASLETILASYDALREKYDRLSQQASDLVKENDKLRLNLQLESEDALQAEYRQLHYLVRTWCVQFSETARHDTNKATPTIPSLPLSTSRETYTLLDPNRQRIDYSIACVWEQLVHHLFYSGRIRKGAVKDLWTTQRNAKCIAHLETALAGAASKDAHAWRCLTVRLLSQQLPPQSDETVDGLIKDIMESTIQILGEPSNESCLNALRQALIESVIKKAVHFSLVIRRQIAMIEVCVPKSETISDASGEQEKVLPALPLGNGKVPVGAGAMAQETIEIFTRPALVRYTTDKGQDTAGTVVIVEPEIVQLSIETWKPVRKNSSGVPRN